MSRTVVGDPLTAEGTQLQAVAASPDGSRIAAVSRDGGLRLWDRSSGQAIGPPLPGHSGSSTAITWLGEDHLLTASPLDGVIAWDTNPADGAARACELAGRDLTRAEWTRYLTDQPYRRTCTDR